jgi:long-chain acyl-CoA synthetase
MPVYLRAILILMHYSEYTLKICSEDIFVHSKFHNYHLTIARRVKRVRDSNALKKLLSTCLEMLYERPWRRFWPKNVPKDLSLEERALCDLIEIQASKYPNRLCISYLGSKMNYGQVRELAARFASALVSLGLKKGDRVALFMPNIPQFVLSYFGTLMAGGVVVPCSALYKERELEHQLRDSESSIVVAANDVVRGNDLFASLEGCRNKLSLSAIITASVTDYLPPIKSRLARLAGVKNVKRQNTLRFKELVDAHKPIQKASPIDPTRDIAVLQYTGGTTGVAKGAMLSHFNLYSNAMASAKWLPLTENDVCLAVLPLFHIYGMTAAMNAPFYAGSRIVLLPRFDVKEVMHTIAKERVTSFCGVPTMYIAIINHPEVSKFNLSSVRACISGGASLPLAVRKSFMKITGGKLVEGFGLSEASPVTHCNPLSEDGVVKDASIGIPFPDTDAAIVDLDDPSKFLPPGEIGELAVRGSQVMLGYWKRKDESEAVLKNGWLLTGDIAKMDEDGYFFIVDRKKDMIDVSGFKVYPREVEEVLFEDPAVKEAAVIGVSDEYSGEAVTAYVVLKDDSKGKVSEAELINFCAGKLAKYKVPKSIIFADDLPKTLIGKVLRRKLREGISGAQ